MPEAHDVRPKAFKEGEDMFSAQPKLMDQAIDIEVCVVVGWPEK